ncbi:hypothetical protein B0J11DRAFT_517161 [Dendryphion nanum]|uniref:DUF6594 domain-containing protein n=1 Tax=Dendryphion nanum TaxID=256645 RepID=A0A9P9IWJ6_9PLEO|nr:hypothetical protein B0J11DRAFT_517161 [Dendryphion nanum]
MTNALIDEALIQQSILHNLTPPDHFDLGNLQSFIESNDFGPCTLKDKDSTIWGNSYDPDSQASDLITTNPCVRVDAFITWIARRMPILFEYGLGRFVRKDRYLGNVILGSSVMKMTFWITAVVAALLPIASILVLGWLESLAARFASMSVFNLLVSGCLILFTDARRLDLFAVSAVFAIVQIVFLVAERRPSKECR